MKARLTLPLLVALGLLTAACETRAPVDLTARDEAAIRDLFDASLTAIRAADWAGWAALFSEDAVLHPPNGPAVSGREAIRMWAEAYPPIDAIDFLNVRVWGAGNVAYAICGYTLTTSGSPPDTGKVLDVFWRDPDGTWQVVAASFNSDLPMPATAEQFMPAFQR